MKKPVYLSKKFKKNFKARIGTNSKLVSRFEKRLAIFLKNKRSSNLKDHALRGSKLGLRAFSITGDVRVIYVEREKHFLFVDIGTHNQVY